MFWLAGARVEDDDYKQDYDEEDQAMTNNEQIVQINKLLFIKISHNR
jgi:hypothetical protein